MINDQIKHLPTNRWPGRPYRWAFSHPVKRLPMESETRRGMPHREVQYVIQK
jgi:hypothetical protein